MTKIRLTEQQRQARDRKILEMYRDGTPYKKISEELHVSGKTIRTIAQKDGCWIKGRRSLTNQKSHRVYKAATKVEDYNTVGAKERQAREKAAEAVDIEKVRSKIKIGDVLKVRTAKAIVINGDSGNVISGVVRDAVVIDKTNRNFCRIKLPSGVEDSVRWSDIYVAQRDGCSVIG